VQESGDSVVSGMQVVTQNIEIEEASLATGWQPSVDLEATFFNLCLLVFKL
jgi:hypothetical protein